MKQLTKLNFKGQSIYPGINVLLSAESLPDGRQAMDTALPQAGMRIRNGLNHL